MEENMTLILGLYAAGLAVSGLLFAYRLGKAGEKRLCALIGMILGLPLAYAGAKLFFLLHNAGLDLRNWSAETMFLPRWEELSFAGGCLGFVLGIRVAAGILRVPGGKALDLFAVPGCILIIFARMAEEAGFRILFDEDLSAAWKAYYIEALWRGETCDCELPRGKCGYRLLIAEKEE